MMPAFTRYRPRAGHPDWPRLLAEAHALATELLPKLERPPARWRDLGRRVHSYATAARAFVENRRRALAGREDLLPLYFIWTTHRTCNFRCTYCDDHRGQKYPDLPADGALTTAQGEALLQVMRTRAASVYFAGGEPTLRGDLPRLTRRARELDYFPIIVNTNASAIARRLAQPAWRSWLGDTDVVVVSLDGLELDWLRRTWSTPRPEDVLRNLLLLRELAGPLGFKLVVNAVIQPGQTQHARDVLDLAGDLGIWFSPVPVNVAAAVSAELAGDPDYVALAHEILARKAAGDRINGSARMNRRLLLSEPLDCRNTLKPHIDHDGKLFWPCKASVNVKPVMIDVLDFPDVDALWAHASARMDPTGFHGCGPAQCGGRCNWAQNYSTDAYAHGLLSPSSLLGEVAEFLRPS